MSFYTFTVSQTHTHTHTHTSHTQLHLPLVFKIASFALTVFLDCLHTKIKSSTLLAKPYTQEAKHQPIFAQL